MKKIVRGKIKSINAAVIRQEANSNGEDIECIEYRIILENDNNEYITKSSLNFKEGDVVDICFDADKKNKDNIKRGVIVNKKVSNKLLEQFKMIKILKWVSYSLLSSICALFTYSIYLSNIPMDLFSWVFCSFIAFVYVVFIVCMEDLYNKNKLSKEDEKVLKQYKKDFKIENEESLDKVKQVQVI